MYNKHLCFVKHMFLTCLFLSMCLFVYASVYNIYIYIYMYMQFHVRRVYVCVCMCKASRKVHGFLKTQFPQVWGPQRHEPPVLQADVFLGLQAQHIPLWGPNSAHGPQFAAPELMLPMIYRTCRSASLQAHWGFLSL